MSVKIYANSNDLNILHFPELNRYKFKVSTKGDAFFDTPLIVSATDETTRLRQQLEIWLKAMDETLDFLDKLERVKGGTTAAFRLNKALAQIRELEK